MLFMFFRKIDEDVWIALRHFFRFENGWIHGLQIVGDDRGKLHVCQNIFLQIYTRSDFLQNYLSILQFEDSSFGNINHILSRFGGVLAAEGDLIYLFQEFLTGPIFEDRKFPVFHLELWFTIHKGCAKNHVFRIL